MALINAFLVGNGGGGGNPGVQLVIRTELRQIRGGLGKEFRNVVIGLLPVKLVSHGLRTQ